MKGAWLGIDTVFGTGAVSVVRGGTVLSRGSVPPSLSTSEGLLPGVQRALEHAGLRGTELEGIAFTLGPGSYTGLRIGTATAHGLSQGWGVPLKGVPTLRLLAFHSGSPGPVLAAVRARKGEVFAALMGSWEPSSRELVPPGIYLAGSLTLQVREHAPRALGSGRTEMEGSGLKWLPEGMDTPGPEVCAMLGMRLAEAAGYDANPEPLYLRGFMEEAGASPR